MPAHIPNRVALQMRINETIHAKLKVIAEEENRFLNSQIEYFLKQGVIRYEEEHGEINVQSE